MDALPEQSVLHHRPFRMFWSARVFAAIALQMQTVAVGWQIYELTGRALDLGLVGLAQFVPAVALVLIAGPIVDRYDRRRLAFVAQTVEAFAAAMLAAGTYGGWLTPNLILGMVFVIGAARAFEQPSMQTLLPNIVSAAQLPRAVAASSSATQAAHIAGPAVGGVMFALSPTVLYGACAALWITAGLLVLRVHIERRAPMREPVSLATFFGGIGFIRRNPIVLGAITLDLFAVLLGGATALLPIYAKDIFLTGPWGLGLLRAAPAVGALAMSAVLSYRPILRRVGRAMFLTLSVFGLATIVFAVSTSFWLSLLALVVLGASDMVNVVIRTTLVQLHTPDAMRGRVYAVNSLFIGTSNQLGEFRAGVMAAWIGAVPAVLVGGIGTLMVVLLAIKAFPALYHADEYQDRKA
jgi:MFS family permease